MAGINSDAQLFMDVTQDLLLVQHVEKITRSREGQRSSLLDLIFTDDENSIDTITHAAAVGKSDHDSLVWTFICKSETIKSNRERLNYAKGNYQEIRQHFANIDWNSKLSSINCDEAWSSFKDEYHDAVEKFVPKKKPRNRNKPLWMKAHVKKSVKKKHQLYMKYRNTQRYKDYLEYTKQRNKTKKVINKAQATYEDKLLEFKEKPIKAVLQLCQG